MKVNIGTYPKKGKRKINVTIEDHDLWNLDHTLALIILPALKLFKENLVGCAYTDVADTPLLADTFNEEGYSEEAYEHILNEMIWAFEQVIDNKSKTPFFESTNHPNGFDKEGLEKHENRVRDGLTFFGKYFQTLWQ